MASRASVSVASALAAPANGPRLLLLAGQSWLATAGAQKQDLYRRVIGLGDAYASYLEDQTAALWSSGALADADQADLVGEDHGLDAISQAELGQHPPDVRLHGSLAEE